jgi:hypothetical protein
MVSGRWVDTKDGLSVDTNGVFYSSGIPNVKLNGAPGALFNDLSQAPLSSIATATGTSYPPMKAPRAASVTSLRRSRSKWVHMATTISSHHHLPTCDKQLHHAPPSPHARTSTGKKNDRAQAVMGVIGYPHESRARSIACRKQFVWLAALSMWRTGRRSREPTAAG